MFHHYNIDLLLFQYKKIYPRNMHGAQFLLCNMFIQIYTQTHAFINHLRRVISL